jgi:hypothetical protein
LEAAIAVWTYGEESARLLFRTKTGDKLGDRLLDLLAGGPKTRDQLNDHLSNEQKRRTDAVLAQMEAAGLARQSTVKPEGGGRPATVWQRV